MTELKTTAKLEDNGFVKITYFFEDIEEKKSIDINPHNPLLYAMSTYIAQMENGVLEDEKGAQLVLRCVFSIIGGDETLIEITEFCQRNKHPLNIQEIILSINDAVKEITENSGDSKEKKASKKR